MEIKRDYLNIKSNIKSERAYYISLFLERINEERKDTKWKLLSARAIANKVGHLKTPEIRDFYYQCEKARNFSEWFFGRLRFKVK